jgi:hypothetical protein
MRRAVPLGEGGGKGGRPVESLPEAGQPGTNRVDPPHVDLVRRGRHGRQRRVNASRVGNSAAAGLLGSGHPAFALEERHAASGLAHVEGQHPAHGPAVPIT